MRMERVIKWKEGHSYFAREAKTIKERVELILNEIKLDYKILRDDTDIFNDSISIVTFHMSDMV